MVEHGKRRTLPARPFAITAKHRGIPLRPHINRLMARRRGHNRAFIAIDVVELGLSSLLRLAHAHRFPRHQLCHFACRIAQVSSNDGVFRANDHASGFQSHFGAMGAEMALSSRAIVRIHVNRIVRTRLHAGLATNAPVRIEIDDPVLALVHRRHGTNRDARRFLAMVAAGDLKYAARIGEHALLHVLYPSPVHAHRHLVLGFARHRAGVTTDALAVIDYEAVFHPLDISTRRSQSYVGPRERGVTLLSLLATFFTNCHPEHSEGSAVHRKMQLPRCDR
jgi:hypothetical protein